MGTCLGDLVYMGLFWMTYEELGRRAQGILIWSDMIDITMRYL